MMNQNRGVASVVALLKNQAEIGKGLVTFISSLHTAPNTPEIKVQVDWNFYILIMFVIEEMEQSLKDQTSPRFPFSISLLPAALSKLKRIKNMFVYVHEPQL